MTEKTPFHSCISEVFLFSCVNWNTQLVATFFRKTRLSIFSKKKTFHSYTFPDCLLTSAHFKLLRKQDVFRNGTMQQFFARSKSYFCEKRGYLLRISISTKHRKSSDFGPTNVFFLTKKTSFWLKTRLSTAYFNLRKRQEIFRMRLWNVFFELKRVFFNFFL